MFDKFDSFFVTSFQNIFYLTGYAGFSKEEREAYLLITKKRKYLLTDHRYLNELNFLKDFILIEISPDKPLTKSLEKIFRENKLVKTGFEAENLTFHEYVKFRKSSKKLMSADYIFENLREIKSKDEILKIKKACRVTDLGFNYVLKQIKENITEQELSDKLEIFFKQNNADSAFKPIIAFGKNSAVAHHLNSETKLKKGNIVLIDMGAKIDGYCSDMTRTVFFGSPSTKFVNIYKTVLESQKKAVEFINHKSLILNQKTYAAEVDKAARSYIIDKGFETVPHSLGHGIGIDVHEKPGLSPKSKSVLKNNMVFSIEPGIYLNGFGGVRIEDLYLLKEKKLEKITHSTSQIISL